MDVHAVGTVVEVEVVNVHRTHVDLQRVGDLAERHLQALGFFAVDVNDVLRIVSGEAAEEAHQVFARVSFGSQFVGGGRDGLQRITSQVFQFKLESAELAEAEDGRRIEHDHDGARESG